MIPYILKKQLIVHCFYQKNLNNDPKWASENSLNINDILSGVDVINFILAYKIIATAKKYNEKCNFDKRPIMGFIIRTWTH